VKYAQYADCPKFKEFIQEVTERDGTDIKTIQEMMGYTLLKNNNKYDKAFLFLGAGSNGKSVLSDVIAEMLGEKNVSAVSLDTLNNRNFTGSDLHQKLANISAESQSEKLKNTKRFRRAAVGDLMRAEEKFEKAFKFRNYATLIFSFNNLPRIKKPTKAFYRRWIPFTFDVRFTRKNDGNPDIDEDLSGKLTTEQELSGILNFALKGLKRLRKNGQFTKSVSAEEMRHFWLNHSTPMNQFLTEHIQQDSNSQETKDDLFERYQDFCSKENVPSDSRQKFFKILKDKFPVKEKRPMIGGKRKRVLKGIKLC
jgi:putative DNA primase/helicase